MLVEDEVKIRSFIEKGLKAEGFVVDSLDNGEDAYQQLLIHPYDAVVLDIMIHGRDGLSVLKGIRAKGINTSVILVTARGELDDRLEGLNLGADDYLVKPFSLRELDARVGVLKRRIDDGVKSYEFSGLLLDTEARTLSREGEAVALTPKEFDMLVTFLREQGRAMTREQLLSAVWGNGLLVTVRSVDRCVKTLREKLGEAAGHLVSVRGVGYRWDGK